MGYLQLKTFDLNGARTTIRLEAPLWDALKDIARWEKTSIEYQVNCAISSEIRCQGNTSALRGYIINYYRNLVAENTVLVIIDKKLK